ncbi:unnamed protein product [Caretta caretta]
MNMNKNKQRSSLTDDHLQDMKVSTSNMTPEYDNLLPKRDVLSLIKFARIFYLIHSDDHQCTDMDVQHSSLPSPSNVSKMCPFHFYKQSRSPALLSMQ